MSLIYTIHYRTPKNTLKNMFFKILGLSITSIALFITLIGVHVYLLKIKKWKLYTSVIDWVTLPYNLYRLKSYKFNELQYVQIRIEKFKHSQVVKNILLKRISKLRRYK